MPLYFVVFSPLSVYYDIVEKIVLDQMSSITGECILVKEYGKKGNHPHLNLVYKDKVSKKNINRKWKNIFDNYDTDILKNNHRLLLCTTVFNKEKLIEGYLDKEDNCEVLYKRYIRTAAEKRESKNLIKEGKDRVKKIKEMTLLELDQAILDMYIRYTKEL